MQHVRITWQRDGVPKFCRGCGRVLMMEPIEDQHSDRFDPIHGLAVPPRTRMRAWCDEGERERLQPPSERDSEVFHDDWWIRP